MICIDVGKEEVLKSQTRRTSHSLANYNFICTQMFVSSSNETELSSSECTSNTVHMAIKVCSLLMGIIPVLFQYMYIYHSYILSPSNTSPVDQATPLEKAQIAIIVNQSTQSEVRIDHNILLLDMIFVWRRCTFSLGLADLCFSQIVDGFLKLRHQFAYSQLVIVHLSLP